MSMIINSYQLLAIGVNQKHCPATSGWWLEHGWIMTFYIFFYILGMSSSQVTNSFQRGRAGLNHQPVIHHASWLFLHGFPMEFVALLWLNPTWIPGETCNFLGLSLW